MGWDAAYAFYQENSSWLESPTDAYEALYGMDQGHRKAANRCPLCGKRLKSKRGIIQHIQDYHQNAKGQSALAELGDPPDPDPSKVGPLFDARPLPSGGSE